MSITAKNLIASKYASDSDHTEYTAAAGTHTIIDKFTATNTDSGSQSLTVNLVPSGGSVSASNLVIKAKSISAGATADITELQNQILNPGDFISVVASVASKVVIRSSGREVA